MRLVNRQRLSIAGPLFYVGTLERLKLRHSSTFYGLELPTIPPTGTVQLGIRRDGSLGYRRPTGYWLCCGQSPSHLPKPILP